MEKVKVFISYARDDFKAAKEIYDELISESDIEPWLDKKDVLPGQRWKSEIRKAINESRFFIFIASENSIKKRSFVHKEIEIAFEILDELPKDHIFIIPVRLDECELPERLNDIQFVDMFRNKTESLNKILDVITIGTELGRLKRTKYIVRSINEFIEKCEKYVEEEVTIRIRAAFTSMSNIQHYSGKKIKDIDSKERSDLDILLEEECERITYLLNLKNVHLKCICWPMAKFLKYYSREEKVCRFELLKSFLNDSIKKYSKNRQILCDVGGKDGNSLILNTDIAIVANPQSGGYKKTSVIKDRQAVAVLTNEFDYQFQRILKRKFDFGEYLRGEELNKITMYNTLNIINNELKKID